MAKQFMVTYVEDESHDALGSWDVMAESESEIREAFDDLCEANGTYIVVSEVGARITLEEALNKAREL